MENSSTLRSGPKDVFLHLFSIVTFYLTIIGFITLYIQYINAIFPDALNYYFIAIAESVRVASSILFISVPAYLVSSWLLAKDIKEVPEKREFKLRKWLLYFTLFVSAIVIIIDLITFIYNFLSGELTTQFFLKILVVLAVAGAVFGYYIWELKRDNLSSKLPKVLALVLGVLTFASICAGFFIVGSPADQRNRRFDEQRVNGLQMLQNQIINYWTQKGELPAKLSDLNDSLSGFMVPLDPETGADFEYSVSNTTTFEFCATFKTVSVENAKSQAYPIYYPNDLFNQNWTHKAERTCFERKIDPELYKVQPQVLKQ